MKNLTSPASLVIGLPSVSETLNTVIDRNHPLFTWASRIFVGGVDFTPLGVISADLKAGHVLTLKTAADDHPANDPHTGLPVTHTYHGHIQIEFKTALLSESGQRNLADLYPELEGHIYVEAPHGA